MSKIEVNQISSQCGSTLTVGQSGDTVTLAAGATQTGFGRTGTVDWDTTAKTASFTAVSGNGYFVNTTSGAITVTLPATPSAGDIVAVSDYAGTASTNNITIARNGSNINGAAEDLTISFENSAITLVYADGTQGWKATDTASLSDITLQPTYIIATGGTITTCGDFKIHTFTGPGSFSVCSVGNPAGGPNNVDYLVIGGGGGGGADRGGGGGGGGYRESSGTNSGSYTVSPLGACVGAIPVTASSFPITVGAGGAGAPGRCGPDSVNGASSVFSTITSAGGGGGAKNFPLKGNGSPGASGGGGVRECGTGIGGTGNTPPVSPPQGQPGGDAPGGNTCIGAGGGGATVAGHNGCEPAVTAGNGGAGGTSSINATPTGRAGGGGGAPGGGPVGSGADGGGNGGSGVTNPGTANTGGGGGGGNSAAAGSGGSGIVIIRYKFQ